MRRIVDAYYSNDLKCWVRLEREADGEWCHTSGYATRAEAVASHLLQATAVVAHFGGQSATQWVHPCDRRG
jgi:cytochrome c biogenesis protein ResB